MNFDINSNRHAICFLSFCLSSILLKSSFVNFIGGGERRGKAQGLGGKEVEGRVGGDVRERRDCEREGEREGWGREEG